MTNHVHLLLTPIHWDGLSTMMQSVGRRYSYYVNKRYSRTGSLWGGRYRSSLIDPLHYLLSCSFYVEFNPVRAGIVKQPGDYFWSSYACNALGVNNEVITYHPIYELLGNDHERRFHAYRKLSSELLHKSDIQMFRRATEQGSVLGSQQFLNKIEALLNRRIKYHKHGGDRRSKTFRGNHVEQY
jgi:putative transposase